MIFKVVSLNRNSVSKFINLDFFASKNNLPHSEVEKIWKLSVLTNNDESLNRDEFYIFNYLLGLRKNGISLPVTLPKCLIPPGYANSKHLIIMTKNN